MQIARQRDNESEALAALARLEVLDTEPEVEFTALVHAAAAICATPMAALSLVDAHRQWFKAAVGLPGVCETPREIGFCAHAVLDDALFEVPDAACDPRFADNPVACGPPAIRFYAGMPLRLGRLTLDHSGASGSRFTLRLPIAAAGA